MDMLFERNFFLNRLSYSMSVILNLLLHFKFDRLLLLDLSLDLLFFLVLRVCIYDEGY